MHVKVVWHARAADDSKLRASAILSPNRQPVVWLAPRSPQTGVLWTTVAPVRDDPLSLFFCCCCPSPFLLSPRRSCSCSCSCSVLLCWATHQPMGSNLSQQARDRIYTCRKNGKTELNLSDCTLVVFPKSILRFKPLKKLVMARNLIQELPPELKKLIQLEDIDVSTNELQVYIFCAFVVLYLTCYKNRLYPKRLENYQTWLHWMLHIIL